jgi:MFS family permease
MGVAVSMLGDIALYIVLPTHTLQAGIALTDVGLMLSANRAIRIFINSPYGVLIERLPRRRVMLFSIGIGTFSTLLYTIPGFWPLLVGRLLWGIAWAGVWIGGSTVVLDICNHDNRGRFVGRLQMWGFIGQGVSALVGGLLTDTLGYTATFYVFAALSLAMGAAWWLFLPETRNQPSPPATLPQGEGSKQEYGEVVSTPPPGPLPKFKAGEKAGAPSEEPSHVRERSTASLVVAVIVMGMNWLIFLGALGAILSLLLRERVGSEILLAGALIPLATFTGALSASTQVLGLLTAPLSGWLSDRLRNRWGLVVLVVVVGIACLLALVNGTGWVVVIAVLVSGVVTSVFQTQAVTIAGDYARENRQGRIIGLLNTVGDIGSAGGPFLAFLLLPVIGLDGIFTSLAALLLLLLPAVVWVAWRETRR